jgi:hypothetical protein
MEKKMKNKADMLSFENVGKTVSKREKIIRMRQEVAVLLANITSQIELGVADEKAILSLRTKFGNVARWLTEMNAVITSEIKGRSLENALQKT